MQVRAIMEAACDLTAEGVDVIPEIMIPLVGIEDELRQLREARRSRPPRRVLAETRRARRVHRRHDDRAAARLHHRRRDRRARRLLLLRHERPHPDDLRHLAATTPATSCPPTSTRACWRSDPFVGLDHEGVGGLMRIGIERGRAAQARPEGRHLRRARRRPRLGRVLPRRRPRLRLLLALPRADRPRRRRPGRARGTTWPRACAPSRTGRNRIDAGRR